jgi:cobalamin synthase
MVAGALLALVLSLALLVASLFRTDGLTLVWASLATDLVAVALLAAALRRRRAAARRSSSGP